MKILILWNYILLDHCDVLTRGHNEYKDITLSDDDQYKNLSKGM